MPLRCWADCMICSDRSTAWICWVAPTPQRQSPGVRAVREVVLELWH